MKMEIDPCNKFSDYLLNDILGIIPHWLSAEPHLPADEAIDVHYQHGGGWRRFDGFTMKDNGVLSYPEDPDMYPIARYTDRRDHKDEVIYQYMYGWVAVYNTVTEDLNVARID